MTSSNARRGRLLLAAGLLATLTGTLTAPGAASAQEAPPAPAPPPTGTGVADPERGPVTAAAPAVPVPGQPSFTG